MQNFNLIAQSVLKLSHCEKGTQRQRRRRRRQRRRHPSGLNYSPRRKVFRRGQKSEKNDGPRRNDEGQGLNDEGQGLYVPFIHILS